ncbi:hypothetical protein SAMN05660209_05029 [Geodermatophilus africanus]|uniref:PQQ-like domain-containing protein n=1 Tax=Geodermatophilus africanus TaxID=1137993 RepID=A0A1H3R633_9ACTN|nr:hypothetical protein [Geodermatophilus africanus]SDZ20785.1 hypothetical protein SAMN05660209_05029 [Geodermatophilus africanus]
MTSFELSPGVVVDRDSGEVYAMSPGGGVVALDLGTGEAVWHSQDAAKPLAVSGNLLVSQAEPTGPANELAIVALDTRQRGTPVMRSRVELPPGVQPTIGQSMNRSFIAHAEPLETDASVSWEFVERPLQGIAWGPLEVLPGEEAPPVTSAEVAPGAATAEPGAEVVIERGAVRVGLTDGTVTTIAPPSPESFTEPTPVTPSAAAPVETTAPLPGLPEPQFLSADGSHVLISERLGDESVWEKYQWRIFDRSSGQQVGAIRSHVRFLPFLVSGSQVVYVVEPHVHRQGDALVEEPAQVRAIDLQSGEPRWSQPVRDITDREAPPP